MNFQAIALYQYAHASNNFRSRIASENSKPIQEWGKTLHRIRWKAHPFRDVTIGFCAISAREPSQGRKAAALSGITDVPQVA